MLPRGGAALLVLAVLGTSAGAQVSDELGIERFRGAMDRRGLANVEWADVPTHLHWDAGLLVGFAHAPLVLYDRDMNPVAKLVEQRLTSTLVGAIGLYDRFEIGAAADVIGYQSGDDGSDGVTMTSLPAGGLGDLRLVGKAKLAGDARYQLALLAAFTAPAGSGRGFLREAGVTFAPALALSITQGRVRGALNVGYLARPSTETAGLHSDDEGFARIALGVAASERVEVFASLSAASPLSDVKPNQVSLEALGGVGLSISPTLGAFVAGGVGLDNGYGTPDWRVVAGVRFGSAQAAPAAARVGTIVRVEPPAVKDSDGDGIPDADDRCPTQAEVVNNFRDDDGCPEYPVQLTGRVVAPDGRGIAGATVTIVEAETSTTSSVTSDADGHFAAPVLGGVVQVSAVAPEYQDGATQVEIEPGMPPGTATVTLVRKVRQGQLRGQVLSFDGKPLAATIQATGKTTASATADADGNFTIELPEGSFKVEITAAGYKAQKRTVSVKLDGVTVLNVDLRGAK